MGHNPRLRPARLAAKLRQIRRHLGLSQNQMIRRLGFADQLIQSNISSYELEGEHGREPPLIVLWAYAKVANVSIESLIDDRQKLKLTSEPAAPAKQGGGKKGTIKGRSRKTAR